MPGQNGAFDPGWKFVDAGEHGQLADIPFDLTGHHHLIIDTKLSPEELKAPIAADAKHVHYGGGQTEATVTLPPGQHTLQLVLGNWSHIPHDPPVMSDIVTITVKVPHHHELVKLLEAKTAGRRFLRRVALGQHPLQSLEGVKV